METKLDNNKVFCRNCHTYISIFGQFPATPHTALLKIIFVCLMGTKERPKSTKIKIYSKITVVTSGSVLTHCHCQILSGALQTTGSCTLMLTNLEQNNKEITEANSRFINNSYQETKCCLSPGCVQMLNRWWYTGDGRVWTPNEKANHLLRPKRAPSHTDLQGRANSTNQQTKDKQRSTAARSCAALPVLRLHSQASASTSSCLMGPSQEGLSWRNIHCSGTNIEKRKL